MAVVLVLFLHGLTGAQGVPDLRLDLATLGAGFSYDLVSFAPGACELRAADRCVDAPGARKLLRFDVLAVNQGDADLVLGVPDPDLLLPGGGPMWEFSVCHDHFHFVTFARYELRRRGESMPVLEGQKRSFCVQDTRPVTATTPRRYCCDGACGNRQGVSMGWGDLYPRHLPCQWIDITALPDDAASGEFDLCVSLNTAGVLPDGDRTNDAGCVPISIDAPPPGTRAPRVKVRAPRRRARAREGRRLKIAWRRRVQGEIRFQATRAVDRRRGPALQAETPW